MTDNNKIVLPQSQRYPARYRGPLISSKYNDFQEGVIEDISNLAMAVNSLSSEISKSMLVLANESSYLRRQVRALRGQQDYSEKVAASSETLAFRYIDVGDTRGITFLNDLDDTRSSMLSADYGEVTLPPNAIENKFYVTSLVNGVIVTPPDLIVSVKGTFDKIDGKGLINYEKGGRVIAGDPTMAFNGNNQTFWIRKVEFPIDSRVDQVECELTVTVPESVSTDSNTIEIMPFPNGTVDITELATASDLGDNFIRVPKFEPIDNSTASRYHFATKTVDQIKIRLRQRNWVEENGKKVFYYGLQELGLKFIDYDKNFILNNTFGANNSFVIEIPAPEGYGFNAIYRIDPSPNFLLEDINKRHLHVKISTSSDFSSGVIWNSDTTSAPQLTTTPISALGATRLYAYVELNYVNDSGGILSPFEVGTTPFFKGLGLTYTLLAV
jgi:hypothetical protein